LSKIAREKLKKGQPIISEKREALKKPQKKATRNKDGTIRKNSRY